MDSKSDSKPVKTEVKAEVKVEPESVNMADYEEDVQDFDCSFEEYYECENMDAAFLGDNGMVWDKNEKYIGKFTNDGFVKAS